MNTTMPSATANSGTNHFDLVSGIEHTLYRRFEVSRQGQGQGQGRRVPILLDRVDRLS
jgi:hypothetical protein